MLETQGLNAHGIRFYLAERSHKVQACVNKKFQTKTAATIHDSLRTVILQHLNDLIFAGKLEKMVGSFALSLRPGQRKASGILISF